MTDTSETGLRILVADDDKTFTTTFGWMLELLGHQVAQAHDGHAAVAQAHAFKPDVVMLDISLPGLNGYEICEKLRSDPAFHKTIFIAQTGWSQPEHHERSKAAGFDHHLVKPITMDYLAELLNSLKKQKAAA